MWKYDQQKKRDHSSDQSLGWLWNATSTVFENRETLFPVFTSQGNELISSTYLRYDLSQFPSSGSHLKTFETPFWKRPQLSAPPSDLWRATGNCDSRAEHDEDLERGERKGNAWCLREGWTFTFQVHPGFYPCEDRWKLYAGANNWTIVKSRHNTHPLFGGSFSRGVTVSTVTATTIRI